ncbi:MAG: DUF2520 domain-containing protein [Deltaproteobacteria bacterium]|nr:DUF2520 domain-containing protein [Candidatus Anaeroferrophillus wilburensis]MBN2889029.1 DUF2520 domain-containing protein [Deltaproteobacteria bacterium]
MAETLAFIGMGRVGSALAVLLERAGFSVAAVCDRNQEKLDRAAKELTGSPLCTTDPTAAAAAAQVVFLTTQDRFIETVCCQLAAAGAIRASQLFAHASGSLTAIVLHSAAAEGAKTFSLHPLQSIADPAAAIRVLPGSYYCFEGDDGAYSLAVRLVAALDGHLLRIAAADKPLYHAAAVVASNFFIALEYLAISMMEQVGADPQSAREMLLPLIRGSLENLAQSGPVEALTGPIVRGDNETIAGHLRALEEKMPHYVGIYKGMARLNVELAGKKSGVTLDDFSGTLADG